jgi:hypothetical protein
MRIRFALALFLPLAAASPVAHADLIARIGDVDGFGYGAATGFHAANGGLANKNGDAVLSNGDFLPDITGNHDVQEYGRDDFDHRSAAEVGNTGNSFGAGVSNTNGTRGSNFTDISLSRSYGSSSAAGQVQVGGNPTTGLVYGAGGAFPSPPSTSLPNQPGFVFSFDIAKANLSSQSPIFFNLVFGDYDVRPSKIRITRADGSTEIIGVMTQPNAADGLIQAATATLSFGDVFKEDGSLWGGSLKVDFIAPNEPYTAFDYVELSTTALVPVPEPGSVTLMALGLASIAALARARGRA